MSVIPLTLTISLCLVFTFIVFFLRENSRQRYGSAEREALLPLAEEIPQTMGSPAACHGRKSRQDDRSASRAKADGSGSAPR